MNEYYGEYSDLMYRAREARSAYVAKLLRAAFIRQAGHVQNRIVGRQAEARLSEVSEHELQDIGHRRDDIAAAVRGDRSNDNQAQHAA